MVEPLLAAVVEPSALPVARGTEDPPATAAAAAVRADNLVDDEDLL